MVIKRNGELVEFDKTKIRYRSGERKNTICNCAEIQINDQVFCTHLLNLGVVPRKSGKEIMPNCNGFEKDFIRGMLDGDGAIYKSKMNNKEYNHITFCSYSYSICEDFQKICDSYLNEPNKAKILKDNGKEIYRVHYNDQNKVKQLVTVLYKDSNYYLTRKYILAKDIFEDKNEEDIV